MPGLFQPVIRTKRSLVAALCGLLVVSGADARPHRVVSLNLCTDELVLMLADRSDIAGLSPLATDCTLSVLCLSAQGLPVVPANGERLLGARPDLVVSGTFGADRARAVAGTAGIATLAVAPATTLDDVPRQITTVAHALGQDARGASLIAAFRSRLRALAMPVTNEAPRAVMLDANAYSAGPGTLADSIMQIAGFRDAGSGARLSLERLVADPPDLLIRDASPAAPSLAEAIADHPALRARFGRDRMAIVPGNLLLCALPQSLDAVALLEQARKALPRGHS